MTHYIATEYGKRIPGTESDSASGACMKAFSLGKVAGVSFEAVTEEELDSNRKDHSGEEEQSLHSDCD